MQTINLSFTFSSLIMIQGLVRMGLFTVPVLVVSAAGVLPVFVGTLVGGRIRRRVSEAFYRRMVLWLMAGLGVNILMKVLL